MFSKTSSCKSSLHLSLVMWMLASLIAGCPSVDFETANNDVELETCGLVDEPEWDAKVADAVAMTVGDWDGVQGDEILVISSDELLSVFALDGSLMEQLDLSANADVGSVDFDFISIGQTDEGPVLLGHRLFSNLLQVFDASGDLYWSFESGTLRTYSAKWGDLDGDGQDELVVGHTSGVQILDHTGELRVNSASNEFEQAPLHFADHVSVLSATAEYEAMILIKQFGRIEVRDANLAVIDYGFSFDSAGSGEISAAALPDGDIEVVTFSTTESELIAMNLDGEEQWTTPVFGSHHAVLFPQMLISDEVDGDGIPEWAYVTPSGLLLVRSSSGAPRAAVRMPFSDNASCVDGAGWASIEGYGVAHDQEEAFLLVLIRDRLAAFPINDARAPLAIQ